MNRLFVHTSLKELAPNLSKSCNPVDNRPMSKTRGLTLGKFAPLHKGHQPVIETALRETDEVEVIASRIGSQRPLLVDTQTSLSVVKNYSERIAAARTQPAHSVPQIHPVDTLLTTYRTMMDRKHNAVALAQR